MADEDYGGDEDPSFFFDDDDYLYVEDDYAIADELAETQCPSPGYAGVNDEIALESFEYDVYEYFGELEYGSDSYWDARIRHLNDSLEKERSELVGRGGKRKSEDEHEEAGLARKRRKENDVVENVLYVPFEERIAPLPPRVPDGVEFALLPDWRDRFPEKEGDALPAGKQRQMPADMRRAAEGEDEGDADAEQDQGSQEEGEEMQVDSGGAAGLDQDVVMQVLRQKLADSGLGDVDEAAFKDAIAQMLSGEGDGDDAVGGLASLLLGQKGGGGEAFQGFLAGQGVQLGGGGGEEGDDDDDDDDDHDEHDDNDDDNDDSRSATANTASASASTTPSRPTRASNAARSTSSGAAHSSNTKSRTTQNKRSQPQSSASAGAATSTSKTTQHPTTTTTNTAKSTRKRRAPSLDDPSIPQPEDANEAARPSAKRRRTPGAERAAADEVDISPTEPAKRTTRSAAAAGKRGV